MQGTNTTTEGRRTIFDLIASERESQVLSFDEIKEAVRQGHFNLTDEEINEVIKRVGGVEATDISYDQFEKYLGKKVEARKLK